MKDGTISLQIRPWTEADRDLELLYQLNTSEMTKHLGGPESEEFILARHKRYLELGDRGCMYTVILNHGETAGSVGYWESVWENETVYEIGWSVLPVFQGKGIASQAVTAAIEEARSEKKHRFLHAFPSVSNKASNAICRKLGFTFVNECQFEYPPGSMMQCNNWRLNLE
ncbi:GNAT family N-acetyltransferase [Fictibacillus terranigra]|uniref:GNAT family N-acetyltransferase n=1 Tax=Fictibacillus terranigra TaxID=3058424 RepID=A0ABT8E873_9BACL|nr:GNAT family N-acetyltransferase [Fictibacillus sp. CENA-BCM004]MDN4074107.1 GNAT family N-acetyltransferase [Fictibacillus sp. CENA-BCM004]